MLSSFFLGFISGLGLLFIQSYGKGIIYIALPALVLTTSCTKDDLKPDACLGGCNARVEVDAVLDANGYYHVDIDNEGPSRFNVIVNAKTTDPYYWYNDQPVVSANFLSDDIYVQGSDVYFSFKGDTRMETKRIVGPIFPESVGDTITLTASVFWDAGENYVRKNFPVKIILE